MAKVFSDTHRCTRCGKTGFFYYRNLEKKILKTQCVECESELRRIRLGQLPRPAQVIEGQRICSGCGSAGPFHKAKNSRSADGQTSKCRECRNADARRKHNENRKGYRKVEWRKIKYNLSREKYDNLVLKQDGLCELCGKKPGSKGLVVDHDHSCCPRGKSCGECIRGLICSFCNLRMSLVDEVGIEALEGYLAQRII